jgi:uncharacterized protein (DUF2062 family)
MAERLAWSRLRKFVVYRILHIDDSAHRIALGVAIAFFVAWTPTMGFHMLLSVVIAAALRANKLVGLPVVWIANPFTAVPIYYFNWRLGRAITRGAFEGSLAAKASLAEALSTSNGPLGVLRHVFELHFWRTIGSVSFSIATEMWIGSIVAGLFLAVGSYWMTRHAIQRYRADRASPLARRVCTISIPANQQHPGGAPEGQ